MAASAPFELERFTLTANQIANERHDAAARYRHEGREEERRDGAGNVAGL
jgi:hypothetical protein